MKRIIPVTSGGTRNLQEICAGVNGEIELWIGRSFGLSCGKLSLPLSYFPAPGVSYLDLSRLSYTGLPYQSNSGKTYTFTHLWLSLRKNLTLASGSVISCNLPKNSGLFPNRELRGVFVRRGLENSLPPELAKLGELGSSIDFKDPKINPSSSNKHLFYTTFFPVYGHRRKL